jgi:hypothetical protein
MKVIYAQNYIELQSPSIFLAGPTPRSPNVQSWRPEAINIFEKKGFKGTLCVPEADDGIWKCDYIGQVEWELNYLDKVDLILFWVPRNLKTMPAFTTNCEWGMFLKSNKILYGRPPDSPKNSYLDYTYRKFVKKEPNNTIVDLINNAMEYIQIQNYLYE